MIRLPFLSRVFIAFALLLALADRVRAGDAPDGAPAGVLILAADCSADQVIADAGAIGGKAATSPGEYHPIITAKIPAAGDAFTIWVHRKSGPIQLKATVNGIQQEKIWNWATPAGYEWCSMGRYSRPDLGDGIVIIRAGHQKDPDPSIDCVVFSSDAAAHPKGIKADGGKEMPPEAPDDSIAPTNAALHVNWTKTVGRFTPSTWGVNDYEILDPSTAASPGYQAFLSSIKPGFIRVHQAGLVDQWTDPATRSWRTDRIKAGFAASTGFGGAKVMLNIPSWPSWLATQPDGTLTPQSEDEFVALVGKLVSVMRDDVHRRIDYWELLNERDGQFEKLDKLDDLWKLHNRLFAEIKSQDPSAKVGGPAFTWPKPTWVEGFLKICGKNVDFVTWHNYASGDIYDSNDYVFNRTSAMAEQAQYVKDTVAKSQPGRKIQLFLDEYNVKWTWDPIERRHGNNVGAVFQACLLNRLGALDLDGISVWQAKGHAYGLIEGDNSIRLTGRFYQIGSHCLVGDMAAVSINGEKQLEAIAIRRADGVRSILLINRADHSVIAPVADQADWSAGSPKIIRIASDGLHILDAATEIQTGAIHLPGYSLTLLTEDPSIAGLFKNVR